MNWMRRGILILLLCSGLLGIGGTALLAQERLASCAYVPFLSGDLLPNSDFARDTDGDAMPDGWSAAVAGPVRLAAAGDFTVTGQGRSVQIIGIANALRSPTVAAQPGASYCLIAQALADQAPAPTRMRVRFSWLDAGGALLATDDSAWQTVKTPEGGGWSVLRAGFRAPTGAAMLQLSFHPASDDRIYLDEVHLRHGGWALVPLAPAPSGPRAVGPLVVEPWPEGRAAALSFSFDWETAMGGLIHSRSVDDPNADQDPIARALRMREGVTTTLDLFRPYGIRATYYATGYALLLGNTDHQQFMGNPTYTWANRQNGWPSDVWATTPWFANDPYQTVQRAPAWYFGDLVPQLVRAGHDIQSHTFSHFYGGFVGPADWRVDLEAWRVAAAARGVPMARSLAFPWSSSGGMSYANWDELEAAGITSVTRTSRQPQYRLASYRDPHCRPVPGHERILACPDFYLTEHSAPQARALIDQTIAAGGMLDLWAHTEEVVAPAQIAAWGEVVRYAAAQRDAGKLWIAPLAEIADWQAALADVMVDEMSSADGTAPLRLRITNSSRHDLAGLTLRLPFPIQRLDGDASVVRSSSLIVHSLPAGRSVEVTAWPA